MKDLTLIFVSAKHRVQPEPRGYWCKRGSLVMGVFCFWQWRGGLGIATDGEKPVRPV